MFEWAEGKTAIGSSSEFVPGTSKLSLQQLCQANELKDRFSELLDYVNEGLDTVYQRDLPTYAINQKLDEIYTIDDVLDLMNQK